MPKNILKNKERSGLGLVTNKYLTALPFKRQGSLAAGEKSGSTNLLPNKILLFWVTYRLDCCGGESSLILLAPFGMDSGFSEGSDAVCFRVG